MWGKGFTHPVGQKQPNAFGLFDLHGNLWEWCHDFMDQAAFRKLPDGEPDPGWTKRAEDSRTGAVANASDDRNRVVRGGSWCNSGVGSCSAFRYGLGPVNRIGFIGFRVCLILEWSGLRRQVTAVQGRKLDE